MTPVHPGETSGLANGEGSLPFSLLANQLKAHMSDQDIEKMVKEQGADQAPRVTPEDLKANIVDVEYVKHISHGRKVLRWAVITTKSGFAVTGDPSVSVSPENDREEIGQKVAYDNAVHKLWGLMGYELSQRIALENQISTQSQQG